MRPSKRYCSVLYAAGAVLTRRAEQPEPGERRIVAALAQARRVRHPLILIVALVLAAIGSALALVAPAFDDGISELVYAIAGPSGPPWMLAVARDVTALGSHAVVAALTIACAIILRTAGHPRLAWAAVADGFGAMALSASLKAAIQRPRPDLEHLIEVTSSSFPSGHSLLAAAAWPWLAMLLAAREPVPAVRGLLIAGGWTLAALIGGSRMVLGVHRPSEVLAGLGLGLGWGWLCVRWAKRPVGDPQL